MRRLTLALFFVAAFCGGAFAHGGALSLYTDETLMKCDGIVNLLETYNLNMYYVKGTGPDLGRGVEFRLRRSSGLSIFQDPTWSSKYGPSLGNVDDGISLVSSECVGVGETVSYIGTIPIMNIGDMDTFTVKVVAHPGTIPTPEIRVTICAPQDPILVVLGGTFVLSGDALNPGTCNPAVRSKTWGSIKSLYR